MIQLIEFVKDYWAILLALICVIISTTLYRFHVIQLDVEIACIIISYITFSISESIRQLIFRHQVLKQFSLISEAKVIESTSVFFRDLYWAIIDRNTTSIDLCYFTQQPPTKFYHLEHVKYYWEKLPHILLSNSHKRVRRIVMIGNIEMLQWLEEHIQEHMNIPNYSLAVILDINFDNSYLNLCLTSNTQCFVFSPHAPDEQPSYIWIKNNNIYHSLLLSYERMWKKAMLLMKGGSIINQNLYSIRKCLQKI